MNEDLEDVDIKRIAELLHTNEQRITGLFKRRTLHRTPAGHLILDRSVSQIEGGTAIFPWEKYEVVWGFPKIHRAMMLQPALLSHFTTERVAVEEKMNGYNTRVATINNRIVALTRGGHICPYTTEKAESLLPEKIFTDHPEWVLCGEMVGPDNPYVPKETYGIESLQFFLFDIREKKTGKPLTIRERRENAEKYGMQTTKLFGIYPLGVACKKIKEIIQMLGTSGREGVVIKDPEMQDPPLKYTSSQSNCNDLKYAFTYYHDYARSFFYSRVMREAFQSVEWKEGPAEIEARSAQLGENILKPMIQSIKKVQSGERLVENVKIRVKSIQTAEKFKKHLRTLGIDATFNKPVKIKDEYLIEIQKINQRTTDKTESILHGHTHS
ncbi:RNA ligase [Methanosarcinales archaeon ex4572_44]|mgnify:CR=1 FL=1|nr:MAG: RNA ligase [Methanosarcinales archaeon ex4572_44]RLG25628.1 MAG: RNA ligase [Methanosarcinales archaeon]